MVKLNQAKLNYTKLIMAKLNYWSAKEKEC